MVKLGMSSPWVIFYRKVEAFFKEDHEVKVVYFDNDDGCELKLYVDNNAKAEALSKMLPSEKVFGNVTLPIKVIPNNKYNVSTKDVLSDAFNGNRAVVDIQVIDCIFSNKFTYVIFSPKVVQYFTDDISDIHGINSTLYQNIAKEIFEFPNVYYCTDLIPVEKAMSRKL